MALNTREKRANSLGVGRIWMRGARVAVGASDEQARIATGLGYGGNALSAVAAVAVILLANIAGRNPALAIVAGANPKIDLVAGRNPEIDDVTGKG